MNTVSVLEATRHKGRVRIVLDQGTTLELTRHVADKLGIQPGKTLCLAEVEKLVNAERFQLALDQALRFLGPRPRSEAEIRTRLRRNAVDDETILQVIDELRTRGLIDDLAFARFWCENRESFKPAGRRLLRFELRQKGLQASTIAEVTEAVDEEECAYQAAVGRAARLSRQDYAAFRQDLGSFLKRRGFGYDLIKSTMDRVWREQDSAMR
ncbi:MAG: regulatory protein RecX [Dehalococcoidia bacterium]|nr:regulatory protein RecX [Dehalococcoidia bacterium]